MSAYPVTLAYCENHVCGLGNHAVIGYDPLQLIVDMLIAKQIPGERMIIYSHK